MGKELVIMLAYFIYYIADHSGHEIIESVLFDKELAQKRCHRLNVNWAKHMSVWDGSQYMYDLVAKKLPVTDFDISECDECGLYNICKCNLKKIYKTKEEYDDYWRVERKAHNQNHSYKEPTTNCEFCIEDLKRHKELELIV